MAEERRPLVGDWPVHILLFNLFSARQPLRGDIPFSDFLTLVETGKVKEVIFRGHAVSGLLKDGSTFKTYTLDYPDLVKSLREQHVAILVRPTNEEPWYAIVLQWIPMLIFIGVWVFMMRKWRGPGGTGPRQG